MKKFFSCLLILALLSACVPNQGMKTTLVPQRTNSSSPTATVAANIPWWKTAVFYEIFVRSFYDSNGDGIGDFNGITQKLDYLQSLGVNALWLMPIYPSPSYHGYDVINYFNVNPEYGTLEDFKQLLAAAHKKGMHVILDLELNHTSSQSPWFVDANNDPNSQYHNWYIWSDTDPGYVGPQGIAWHPGKQGYYYGIFNDAMPDLNYQNPAVTAEMEKVVQFWLKDIGVDGFRLDAINYLIEEGQKQINTASTHNWLKGFYTFYKAQNPQAYTVGEVYGADASLAKTYTGDQMDMVFNFEIASSILNSAKGGSNSAINSALTFAQQSLPNWDFATFLTNHDQNRTMSTLSGNIQQAKLAAFLLLTSPGTPFVYYGEEIGMQGEKPDEDIRLPMQWTADAAAGFTTGTPWRAPNADFGQVNVAAEQQDAQSLLNFYTRLIAVREKNPTLATGALTILPGQNSGLYAVLRKDQNGIFVVLANLTTADISEPQLSVPQNQLPVGTYTAQLLFGSAKISDLQIAAGGESPWQPSATLPAGACLIVQLTKK